MTYTRIKFFLLLFFIFTTTIQVVLSQKTVTGKVTDADDGSGLPGATVAVEGTTVGTVTNLDGYYSIEVEGPESVLNYSFVGYLSEKVDVGNQDEINVTLVRDIQALDEVVVIGYGSIKKSDLTGSVGSIKSEELQKAQMVSLEQGIQGRVAGVHVTQTSAEPGGGMSILIRGANSMLGGTEPLYVVDGIPVSSDNSEFSPGMFSGSDAGQSTQSANVLASLNPSDIHSIEILKDASATAIYGSRGANGVVLITTKSGQQGESNIDFSYSYGLSEITKNIDMLDPITYANYINEASINKVTKNPITGELIPGQPVYYDRDSVEVGEGQDPPPYIPIAGEGTNWQDAIYRKASTQNYSMGFTGGNQNLVYSILGNHMRQEGIIIGSKYDRSSLRVNLDGDISDRLRIESRNFVSQSNNRMVSTSTRTDGNFGGIVRGALSMPPTRELQTITPEYNPSDEDYQSNPYLEATEPRQLRIDSRVMSNMALNYKILEDLTLRVNGGVNYMNIKRDEYYPRTTYRGLNNNGAALLSSYEQMHLINENQLLYNKQFGKHKLNLTGVFSYETTKSQNLRNQAGNFLNDNLENYSMSSGDQSTFVIDNNVQEYSLLSLTGRINYNINEKYLITATFRRDGSSKFGEANKFGFFPSVALGWRMSQERFIKNISMISNLKLRASWGQSGNQAIKPYQSQPLLITTYYPFNDKLEVAYLDFYGNLANKALRWETTTQANAGIDAGFFDNRFRFTFDFYNKVTEDLLQQVVLPFSTGFTQQLQNAGSIENRGFELMLGATIVDRAVRWEISTNYSRNRNEIVEIAPGYEQQFAPSLGVGRMQFQPFIQKPGLPLGTIWGYLEDGIFQNEEELTAYKSAPNLAVGEVRYKDISGPEGVPDSIISDHDRVAIGDVNPDFILGLTNSFSYKNFELTVLLQGVIGSDVLNQTKMMISGMYDSRANVTREAYEQRWTGEGTSDSQPQAILGTGRTLVFSDRYVEDGSFLRVKNIRLNYNLSGKRINQSWFENAQVYVNISNLYTLTNYSGYDPEVSAFGQDPSRRGVDAGNYPFSRTYTAGLNFRF